jgi:hypothetical protein
VNSKKSNWILPLIASVCSAVSFAYGQSPNVKSQAAIELSADRQLFIDDAFVESRAFLSRVMHQPVKDAKPILVGDQPWEHWTVDVFGIPSVHFDSSTGEYRMWYTAYDTPNNQYYICYANGNDGVHWRKPILGIQEMNGSTANNIVNVGRVFWLNSTVLIDDHDPDPDRRYKSLSWDFGPLPASEVVPQGAPRPSPAAELKTGRALGVSIAFSRDGLHWKLYDGNPVLKDSGDTNFVLGWDETHKEYVGYFRATYESSGGSRVIGRSTSPDFIHWTVPKIILKPDLEDPITDEFYGMPVVKYQGKYIGFLWVFHNSPNPVFVPAPRNLHGNQQKMDTQLAFSEDGEHFIRVGDRGTFLPVGSDIRWDSGMVTVSDMIEHGDELWFYYGGWGVRHSGVDITNPENETQAFGTIVDGQRKIAAAGLARMRLDGFVSLHAGGDEGVLLTRRIKITNQKRLYFNVDASHGMLWAELLNDQNNPISGFGRADFYPLQTNNVHSEARWKTGHVLSELRGHVIQIRMYFRNADLYSLSLEP